MSLNSCPAMTATTGGEEIERASKAVCAETRVPRRHQSRGQEERSDCVERDPFFHQSGLESPVGATSRAAVDAVMSTPSVETGVRSPCVSSSSNEFSASTSASPAAAASECSRDNSHNNEECENVFQNFMKCAATKLSQVNSVEVELQSFSEFGNQDSRGQQQPFPEIKSVASVSSFSTAGLGGENSGDRDRDADGGRGRGGGGSDSSGEYEDRNNEESSDEHRLSSAVRDAGQYADGVSAVELWLLDPDTQNLIHLPGGWWRDPAFLSDSEDALSRLEDSLRPDFLPADPVIPGTGLAGKLWGEVPSQDRGLLSSSETKSADSQHSLGDTWRSLWFSGHGDKRSSWDIQDNIDVSEGGTGSTWHNMRNVFSATQRNSLQFLRRSLRQSKHQSKNEWETKGMQKDDEGTRSFDEENDGPSLVEVGYGGCDHHGLVGEPQHRMENRKSRVSFAIPPTSMYNIARNNNDACDSNIEIERDAVCETPEGYHDTHTQDNANKPRRRKSGTAELLPKPLLSTRAQSVDQQPPEFCTRAQSELVQPPPPPPELSRAETLAVVQPSASTSLLHTEDRRVLSQLSLTDEKKKPGNNRRKSIFERGSVVLSTMIRRVRQESSPSNALVWRDLRSLSVDPDHPTSARLVLLEDAGFAQASGIRFDIHGTKGIVLFYARSDVCPETLTSPVNEDCLRSGAQLVGAAAAFAAPRAASAASKRERLLTQVQNKDLGSCPKSPGGKISADLSSDQERFAAAAVTWTRTWARKCAGGDLQPPPPFTSCQTGITFFGAFVTMQILGRMAEFVTKVTDGRHVLQMGPFGALMCLQYGLVMAPASQPRSAIFGQASAISLTLVMMHLCDAVNLPRSTAVALTVATSIAFLVRKGITHPPAGASAVIAATGGFSWISLGIFLVGNVVAMVTATAINNISNKRQYPTFWRLSLAETFLGGLPKVPRVLVMNHAAKSVIRSKEKIGGMEMATYEKESEDTAFNVSYSSSDVSNKRKPLRQIRALPRVPVFEEEPDSFK